jgi:O-antigen/teichoic acid export membrane protein
MNILQKIKKHLEEDPLLQRVVRNTGYLFGSNTVTMGLSMLQSILAARLLGIYDFGVLGTITVFATTLNRLFSFRMGEIIIKYLGDYLAENRPDHAATIIKTAYIVEGASSLFAYILLVILSPWAANQLADNPESVTLFIIYGLCILGNFGSETSLGILQVDNKFKQQATFTIIQAVLTAVIIVVAYFAGGGLMMVLLAYLAGKLVLGIGPFILAIRSTNHLLGNRWWKRASYSLLPPRAELQTFGLTGNLSATINLFVRDSEVLWVAFFLSPLEAGYYKVALAIINIVLMPITPFISTTFPEITRSVSSRLWGTLRNLLKKVTILSASWTAVVTIGLLLFGPWIILIYGQEYMPAYPALLILMAGFGIANIFFWNRPLLLALGLPKIPFTITLCAGIGKILLAFLLVPRYGYLAEAALLSLYFIISVLIITTIGIKKIKYYENGAGSLQISNL